MSTSAACALVLASNATAAMPPRKRMTGPTIRLRARRIGCRYYPRKLQLWLRDRLKKNDCCLFVTGAWKPLVLRAMQHMRISNSSMTSETGHGHSQPTARRRRAAKSLPRPALPPLVHLCPNGKSDEDGGNQQHHI